MRFLKSVLLLLALTVALYVGTFVILTHVKVKGRALIFRTADYYKGRGGHTWLRFQEFDPAAKHDVVIMGSSHAYRGYDPHVFVARGYSAFNLGSPLQTPLNSYELIKGYLDSSNTDLLVMDVFYNSFRSTGLESASNLIQNVTTDKLAIKMAWSLHDLRTLNMVMLRFARPDITSEPGTSQYIGLGYAYNADSVKKALDPYSDTTMQIDAVQRKYFPMCVQLCQKRGIRMVVSSQYGRNGWNRKQQAKFAAFIDSTLAGTGIPYLNYTFEPGIDDLNNFADDHHLNDSGAQIFTGNLVDSLESLGILNRKQMTFRPGNGGRSE